MRAMCHMYEWLMFRPTPCEREVSAYTVHQHWHWPLWFISEMPTSCGQLQRRFSVSGEAWEVTSPPAVGEAGLGTFPATVGDTRVVTSWLLLQLRDEAGLVTSILHSYGWDYSGDLSFNCGWAGVVTPPQSVGVTGVVTPPQSVGMTGVVTSPQAVGEVGVVTPAPVGGRGWHAKLFSSCGLGRNFELSFNPEKASRSDLFSSMWGGWM